MADAVLEGRETLSKSMAEETEKAAAEEKVHQEEKAAAEAEVKETK